MFQTLLLNTICYIILQPSILGERWQYSVVPLNPEKSDSTDWSNYNNYPYYGMGAYGYATSGGTFFDTRSSPTGDTAWDNELETLDTCMGHSNTALQYHYHGVSEHIVIVSFL